MAGGAPPSSGISTAASSSSSSSSGLPPPPPPPKILLAKPGGAAAVPRLGREDDPAAVVHRSRNAPQPGSLNLLSDSWEFHTDRILPFLTENTDFTVIGIIGPSGVGKSSIMNELYGFDGSSPGMLPPFATQSDETRAMAKHCTSGIELRVSTERLILLDAQPIFSPSILVDMMKSDGSSSVPVLNGESLPADLAHELMGIQLMLTVDLLKHGIPDPSSLTSAHTQHSGQEKENKGNVEGTSEEFSAALAFIHSKLQAQDLSPSNSLLLRKALLQFFCSSSFKINKTGNGSSNIIAADSDSEKLGMFLLPMKVHHNLQGAQFDSYSSMIGKLRDEVLSMNGQPFPRNITEREWLRNSAKIWELVKKSPIISDYCRTLQASGLYRK